MQPCRHAAPSAVPPTWLAVANRPAVLDHSDRWLPAAHAAGEPVEAWRAGRGGEGVCSGVRPVWISCLLMVLPSSRFHREGRLVCIVLWSLDTSPPPSKSAYCVYAVRPGDGGLMACCETATSSIGTTTG